MTKREKVLVTILCILVVGWFVMPLAASLIHISTDQIKAEDSAHTSGHYGLPVAGVRKDSAASLAGSDGDYTFMTFDSDGKLWVNAGTISASFNSEHAEDDAHSSTDDGMLNLAVRNDAGTALAADGDYIPFMVNSDGSLYITSATKQSEDATHSTGHAGTVILSKRTDTAASSAGTDADYATINSDENGKLWITGTYLEDVAHGSGDQGVPSFAVRQDTISSLAGSDGDYSPLSVNSSGYLYTTAREAVVEDVAHGSGDRGYLSMAVRNDTLAALAGTDGDNAPLQVGATGALFVRIYEAKNFYAQACQKDDVDNSDDNLVVTSGRDLVISTEEDGDGIHINLGAAATTSSFYVPPGTTLILPNGSYSAIHYITAGAETNNIYVCERY